MHSYSVGMHFDNVRHYKPSIGSDVQVALQASIDTRNATEVYDRLIHAVDQQQPLHIQTINRAAAVIIEANMFDGALRFLDLAIERGYRLELFKFSLLLKACGTMRNAKLLFRKMERAGVEVTVVGYTLAVKSFESTGRMMDALELLDFMSLVGKPPNEFTYGVVLKMAAKHSNGNIALNLLREMRRRHGLAPNAPCYSGALITCARCERWEEVDRLLQEMVQNQVPISEGMLVGILWQIKQLATGFSDELSPSNGSFDEEDCDSCPYQDFLTSISQHQWSTQRIEQNNVYLNVTLKLVTKYSVQAVNMTEYLFIAAMSVAQYVGRADAVLKIFPLMSNVNVPPGKVSRRMLFKACRYLKDAQSAVALLQHPLFSDVNGFYASKIMSLCSEQGYHYEAVATLGKFLKYSERRFDDFWVKRPVHELHLLVTGIEEAVKDACNNIPGGEGTVLDAQVSLNDSFNMREAVWQENSQFRDGKVSRRLPSLVNGTLSVRPLYSHDFVDALMVVLPYFYRSDHFYEELSPRSLMWLVKVCIAQNQWGMARKFLLRFTIGTLPTGSMKTSSSHKEFEIGPTLVNTTSTTSSETFAKKMGSFLSRNEIFERVCGYGLVSNQSTEHLRFSLAVIEDLCRSSEFTLAQIVFIHAVERLRQNTSVADWERWRYQQQKQQHHHQQQLLKQNQSLSPTLPTANDGELSSMSSYNVHLYNLYLPHVQPTKWQQSNTSLNASLPQKSPKPDNKSMRRQLNAFFWLFGSAQKLFRDIPLPIQAYRIAALGFLQQQRVDLVLNVHEFADCHHVKDLVLDRLVLLALALSETHYNHTFRLIEQMRANRDPIVYHAGILACKQAAHVQRKQQPHLNVSINATGIPLQPYELAINYLKSISTETGQALTTETVTAAMEVCALSDRVEEMFLLYRTMDKFHIECSNYTYHIMLETLVRHEAWNHTFDLLHNSISDKVHNKCLPTFHQDHFVTHIGTQEGREKLDKLSQISRRRGSPLNSFFLSHSLRKGLGKVQLHLQQQQQLKHEQEQQEQQLLYEGAGYDSGSDVGSEDKRLSAAERDGKGNATFFAASSSTDSATKLKAIAVNSRKQPWSVLNKVSWLQRYERYRQEQQRDILALRQKILGDFDPWTAAIGLRSDGSMTMSSTKSEITDNMGEFVSDFSEATVLTKQRGFGAKKSGVGFGGASSSGTRKKGFGNKASETLNADTSPVSSSATFATKIPTVTTFDYLFDNRHQHQLGLLANQFAYSSSNLPNQSTPRASLTEWDREVARIIDMGTVPVESTAHSRSSSGLHAGSVITLTSRVVNPVDAGYLSADPIFYQTVLLSLRDSGEDELADLLESAYALTGIINTSKVEAMFALLDIAGGVEMLDGRMSNTEIMTTARKFLDLSVGTNFDAYE